METSNFIAKFLPYRIRAAELVVGISTKQLVSWSLEYMLCPYIIYTFGLLWGGVTMLFISVFSCLLAIRLYDWSKRDWLGIEAIKELQNYEGEKSAGRFASWFLKKSEPVVFLFLTVWYDPFITTAYLRHGKFNGMAVRDWKIFFGSLLIGNAYWILACYMGITIVEWAWRGVKGLAL